MTLLLEGALVLALDDAGSAGYLSVVVENGNIAAVGDPADLRQAFAGAEAVDCSARIMLPGLVNAHIHPELQLLKGAVEELDLHGWHNAKHFLEALAFLSTPEAAWIQRAAIRAALADCLLTGTTCVAAYGVTIGSDAAVAALLPGLGLRGFVTARDTTFQPGPADGLPRIFRLHAEEALTHAELEAAAAAHRRGERIVMHAAETEYRVRLVKERFGTTTVRLLDSYDLLSPRVLLSHAIYLDEEEHELLARHGVPVICSPVAEMKLSDGIAPTVEFMRRGLTVALGTDSAVCNNSNDMFLEMRQLGLVQKLRYGAGSISAEQILRAATGGGAAALGGSHQFGAIAVGLAADLVLVDTANPRLQPLVHRDGFSNAAANLVFAATGQDVTDVMIGGRWAVRDRRLMNGEEEHIWEELSRAAASLYSTVL